MTDRDVRRFKDDIQGGETQSETDKKKKTGRVKCGQADRQGRGAVKGQQADRDREIYIIHSQNKVGKQRRLTDS